MTSPAGFLTRLALNDGRVVEAALAADGSEAFIRAWVDTPEGRLPAPPRRVLPHGTVDGLAFILNAEQRALTQP